jgi:hypothetical protein
MKQCIPLFLLLAGIFSCQCADFNVDDIRVGCDCNDETKHDWHVEKIDEHWMEKLGLSQPRMFIPEQIEEGKSQFSNNYARNIGR